MGMAPYGQAEYCIDQLRGLFGVEGLQFRNHTGCSRRAASAYFAPAALPAAVRQHLPPACQLVFEEMMRAVGQERHRRHRAAEGRVLPAARSSTSRRTSSSASCPRWTRSTSTPPATTAARRSAPPSSDTCTCASRRASSRNSSCRRTCTWGWSSPKRRWKRPLKASRPARTGGWPTRPRKSRGLLADGRSSPASTAAKSSARGRWATAASWPTRATCGIIRKLNFAIKQRDFWMPFAASMLEEDADRVHPEPRRAWAVLHDRGVRHDSPRRRGSSSPAPTRSTDHPAAAGQRAEPRLPRHHPRVQGADRASGRC